MVEVNSESRLWLSSPSAHEGLATVRSYQGASRLFSTTPPEIENLLPLIHVHRLAPVVNVERAASSLRSNRRLIWEGHA